MTGSEIASEVPPPGEIARVVEHLFRHEAGKMVSLTAYHFWGEV